MLEYLFYGRYSNIMKSVKYRKEILADLLHKRTIATLDEMKDALDTNVDITVFRKLKQLNYITSYSNRGRYYSLEDIAEFDEDGLWKYRSICFSNHGTLMNTAAVFVEASDAGFYADELEGRLFVEVRETLARLCKKGRLSRENLSRKYLYCSADPDKKKKQVTLRRALESEPFQGRLPEGEIHDELRASIVLFFCLLDEQQQRLFAGLESLKWGHGGDRKVAKLLSLDVSTVAKGRRQLLSEDIEVDRTRKAGGGRKPSEKKRRRSLRR